MTGFHNRAVTFACAARADRGRAFLAADTPAGRSRLYVTDRGREPGAAGARIARARRLGGGRVPAGARSGSPLSSQCRAGDHFSLDRFQRLAISARHPKGELHQAAGRAPPCSPPRKHSPFTWTRSSIPIRRTCRNWRRLLGFLKAQDQPALPAMANVGIVDDGSPAMGEVLNMLTRRNLLYRVVAKPDPKLDLTVQLGDPDFPKEVGRTTRAISPRACAANWATTSAWSVSTEATRPSRISPAMANAPGCSC